MLNLPLAPVWAKLLQIPRPYLYAGILFFATLGAYAVNLQAVRPGLLLVLGLLGFMMRRFGLPVLPLILGVILGPRIEEELRKSLQLSDGQLLGPVQRAGGPGRLRDRAGRPGLAACRPTGTPLAGGAEGCRRPQRGHRP